MSSWFPTRRDLFQQLAIERIIDALGGAAGDDPQHAPRLAPLRRLDVGVGEALVAHQPLAQAHQARIVPLLVAQRCLELEDLADLSYLGIVAGALARQRLLHVRLT